MVAAAGEMPVMFGVTVKGTPVLATPLTVTTTLPLVAAAGTVTSSEVVLQVVTVAAVPLNVTVPEAPKLEPEMVIGVPTVPELTDRPLMLGGVAETVKFTPLLGAAPTVTTTLPEMAPLGTGTTMDVELQLVGIAVVPSNVTVLVP